MVSSNCPKLDSSFKSSKYLITTDREEMATWKIKVQQKCNHIRSQPDNWSWGIGETKFECNVDNREFVLEQQFFKIKLLPKT